MALARFSSAAFSTASGLAVAAGATVTVREAAGGALASIFSDRDGLSGLANPLTADASGRFSFTVAPAEEGYDVTVDDGVASHTVENIFDSAVGNALGSTFTHSDSALTGTVLHKLQQSVSVKDEPFGAVGDGVTDDAAAIQAAIDYCITNGRSLFMPVGDYKIDSPLFIWKWSGTAFSYCSLSITGEKRPWDDNVAGSVASTRILPSFNNTFGIGIQNGRGVRLKDIVVKGVNVLTLTFPSYPEMMTDANFVTGTCRDSRYSPYAGICVDPFGTSVPADGGYPGLSSRYVATSAGSSGIEFESVKCYNFVVGTIIAPNGTTQNAEDIAFEDCVMAYNKVGVAVCQSQSRDVTWKGGEVAFHLYCFDGNTYGQQQGHTPQIYGCTVAGKYIFNHYNRTGAPIIANGLHAESFASIGYIGASASSQADPAIFNGCCFNFSDFGGIFPDHHLVSYGPVLFNACTFSTANAAKKMPLRFLRGTQNRGIKFDSCFLGECPLGEFTLAPTVGVSTREFDEIYFENCSVGDSARGSDNGVSMLSHKVIVDFDSILNKCIVPEGSWLFMHAAGLGQNLKFVGGASNTVDLGSVTVTTGANGTATFTVADGSIVRVGDMIYTSTTKNYRNYDGGALASSSNCIGIVTVVSGNDITITGWPQSLTTGTYAINKKWWSRFHRASTGDTHSNTTVDNVTNPTAWADGNAIKGPGIPDGAYIVSGGGTATLTISKAATATASGVRLYDADVYSLTGTAV